jgi:transposase
MMSTTPQPRIIGLDVHPDVFTAAALSGPDAAHAQIHWVTPSLPIAKLERWACEATSEEDLFVLEASGNSFETVERLARMGRTAIVLESLRVGQVQKTYCTTDKLSAVKIARVYMSGLAVVVWAPDETTRARREIYHRYRRAVTDATRGRNRLKSFLSDHAVRLPAGFSLSRPTAEKRLLDTRVWTPVQQQLLKMMLADFQHAEVQRKELRRLMACEIVQDKNLLRLVRLFGVRHIVAFALAAFIGDIHRFRTPKQLVAYIGLNPRVQRSGNSGGNGALAHHGRSDLRALLTEAAHAILRHSNPAQAWGLKLVFRKGRACAAIAVARKLVVACWYLMRGMFTPLEEVTVTLRIKIHKLVTEIGRAAVRQMGYKTSLEFERCLHQQLLTT